MLVTGGAGFVGSHIVDLLLKKSIEVGVLDDFSTGRAKNLRQSRLLTIHRGDIADPRQIKTIVKDYDAVLHQAALVSVPDSISNPIRTNRVNVQGTLNLLEASINSTVQRFVYASSSAVYGNAVSQPIAEEAALAPISNYGVSKLAGEKYCSAYAGVHGLKTVSLRYFNVYGPRQSVGQYAGVITLFARSVLRGIAPTIHGDGSQTRDFVHVKDVARANLLALTGKSKPGIAVNIGTGVPTGVRDLASTLKVLCQREELGERRTRARPGDISRSFADTRKARQILGFQAKIGLRRGLNDVLAWLGESADS